MRANERKPNNVRSTTRKLVVSAFGLTGLFYNTPEPHDTHRRVTYTDPSKARPRVNGTDFSRGGFPSSGPREG